jgi:hemerythrin
MDFITWTNDMSVGIEELDDDHRKLIGIINQLHFGIKAGHERKILRAILNQLLDYAKIHFAREEALLSKAKSPDTLAHKLEHDRFISEIETLQKKFDSTPVATLDLALMTFLRKWQATHVQSFDKQIALALAFKNTRTKRGSRKKTAQG